MESVNCLSQILLSKPSSSFMKSLAFHLKKCSMHYNKVYAVLIISYIKIYKWTILIFFVPKKLINILFTVKKIGITSNTNFNNIHFKFWWFNQDITRGVKSCILWIQLKWFQMIRISVSIKRVCCKFEISIEAYKTLMVRVKN